MDGNAPIPNPLGETGLDLPALVVGAVAMHELFRSYVEGGFTEDQAIKLVAAIVRPA